MKTEAVRKISPKQIASAVDQTGILLGSITRIKVQTNNYGESLCLMGDFALRVTEEGEGEVEYTAKRAYVPRIVEEQLDSVVAHAEGEKVTVEFGMRIFTKENTESRTGYEWAFENLIQPENSIDPLERLRKAIPKALPEGKKPVKKTAEK